jgi:predicted Rossmann fold flavoprotein
LFTFNIKDKRLEGLMGVSTPALVEVKGEKLTAEGPLLITHWGMSGPGILKLSAWGARILAQKNYQFAIQVNWLPNTTKEAIKEQLLTIKKEHGKKAVSKRTEIMLPSRLWDKIVEAANIEEDTKWADLSAKQLNQLVLQLTEAEFKVNGKSTFKEEFVTAGGIELKEIDFKTMQSKLFQHLYFAGEVLNIDAITGGFNFQNAWTTGFIAARAIVENAQNNKDEI